MVMNCPRCHTTKTACEVSSYKRLSERHARPKGFLTAYCRSCNFPISVAFEGRNDSSDTVFTIFEQVITQSKNNISLDQTNLSPIINILGTWPEPPKPKEFQFLPPAVDIAMTEAEKARSIGTPNRMVRGAYRTVIDVATQHIFEENFHVFKEGTKPKQNLSNRIDMLAAHHFLTPSMKDWAHGIRDITNEDVHTSNSVSNEEVAEIAEFADMLLQYLFELPGRVSRAKKEAEQKRSAE